jgi:hypothetical protein
MDELDPATIYFATACYLISALVFIVSFIVICTSQLHQTTLSLVGIYIWEIISLSLMAGALIASSLSLNWVKYLQVGGFFAHWFSISIFTGQYIKVATQTPLLLKRLVYPWCPVALDCFVFALMLIPIVFYERFSDNKHYLMMVYFGDRLLLTFTVFWLQITSIVRIR